jgi:hypothetical protein
MPTTWLTVVRAAELLDLSAPALRRALERRARRARDGAVEAHLDGIRGRKLGAHWRVQLGPGWAVDPPVRPPTA